MISVPDIPTIDRIIARCDAMDAFAKADPFNAATLEATLKAIATELGVKVGVLIHPTRLATTGNPHGPSLYHLLEVLGKEDVLARIGKALPKFGA